MDKGYFSFSQRHDRVWGSAYFVPKRNLREERPGREDDRWPAFSSEINIWPYGY
jgi:hypothetical protein